MISDAWAKINVDETDAQRRKRIETELSSLFQAEAVAVTPPKREQVSADSSWRRLFGGGGEKKNPPPQGDEGSAFSGKGEGFSTRTGEVYYSRPTLADALPFSRGKAAVSSSSPSSTNTDYNSNGDDVDASGRAPRQRAMPRTEEALAMLQQEEFGKVMTQGKEEEEAAKGSRTASVSAKMAYARSLSSRDPNFRGGTDWRDLPHCPLKGHALTEHGLVNVELLTETQAKQRKTAAEGHADGGGFSGSAKRSSRWWLPFTSSRAESSSPGATASPLTSECIVPPEDLLVLCKESGKFRSASKLLSDERYFSKQHDTATTGLARMMPYTVAVASCATVYNVARNFWSTSARQSLFFQYYFTPSRGYSEKELQRLAQKFRTCFVLTSRANLSQLALAGSLTAFACYFRTPSDLEDASPEARRSRLVEEQDAKAHALTRYLWFVYFNHPTYAEHCRTHVLAEGK